MTKSKKWLFIAVIGMILILCVAGFAFTGGGARRAYAVSGLFEGGDELTFTEQQTDEWNQDKKGLLVSGGTSGTSFKLNKVFDGTFDSEIKAVGALNEVPACNEFSVTFTDIESGQTFSVVVGYAKENVTLNFATGPVQRLVSDVCVEADGERAGIYYRPTNNMAAEHTAGFNKEGKYTRFYDGGSAHITFDPATMQIIVEDRAGVWYQDLLVWDFTKSMNDGKILETNLQPFEKYEVTICFENVRGNAGGQIILYKMGSIDFSESLDGYSEIFADFTQNAIVGVPYKLPSARAVTSTGGAVTEGIDVSVTQSPGGTTSCTITDDGYFTPAVESNYTVSYIYRGNAGEIIAQKDYSIYAYPSAAAANTEFVFESELQSSQTVGLNASVYIPGCKISSALNLLRKDVSALVTIEKDGQPISGYTEVVGGFTYVFAETGEYTVEYKCPLSGETQTFAVTVSDSVEGIAVEALPEEVELGSQLDITPARIYIGGQEIVSSVIVRYPSKKAVTGTSFNVDEAGIYTVTYSYTSGGAEKSFDETFTVSENIASFFTLENASVEYAVSEYYNGYSGAMLTVRNNSTVTYSKVIDLSQSKFDDGDTLANKLDQNKYVPLIDLMSHPASIGVNDMSAIFVTLTDIHDEENTMTIRIRYGENGMTASKIRAKGKNQAYTGLNTRTSADGTLGYVVENTEAHEFGGFTARHNFLQTMTNDYMSDTSCRLYYDYEKNALYARPAYDSLSGSEVSWLVCDFDDSSHFNTLWTGFRTGEVRLSLTFSGIDSTSNVLVLSVNGERFGGQLVEDTVAPQLALDLQGDDGMPYGEVGTAYALPEVVMNDNASAVVDSYAEVYYGDRRIEVTKNDEGTFFIPDTTGNYTVIYAATDAFGNQGSISAEITVRTYIGAPTLSVDGDIPSEARLGATIKMPQLSGSGGAGFVTTGIDVTLDGETVPVEYGMLHCDKAGLYIVKLYARDHLGKEDSQTYYINVNYANTPVFDENAFALPPAFVDGETYTFEEYYADYYASASAAPEKVKASISVSDGGGAKQISGSYTAEAGSVNQATVTLTFERSGAETLTVTRTVPVIKLTEQTRFLQNFFVTENLTVSSNSTSVFFDAESNGSAQFTFIRPISDRNLNVQIGTFADMSAYDRLSVILTDSKDPSVQVMLVYERTSDGSYTCSINGENRKSVFTGDNYLQIGYDRSTHDLTDAMGAWAGTVTQCVHGQEFAGFTSGEVYLTVRLEGIEGASRVSVMQINGQRFNYLGSDSVNPVLYINGNLSGKVTQSTTVTAPSAVGYDVLYPVTEVTLTVIAPDGTAIFSGTADRERYFTLGKFGIYQFVYRATDGSGRANYTEITRAITVYDGVAPTLEFESEMITTIDVGYMLTLPNYTIVDNTDTSECDVSISVITPRGICEVVTDNTVKFFYKGRYTITYLVIDADENSNMYVFYIDAQ